LCKKGTSDVRKGKSEINEGMKKNSSQIDLLIDENNA
jgi:hypothetical protein